MLPTVILKILPDFFYGVTLISRIYFKEINNQIENILNKSVILMHRKDSLNSRKGRLKFDELCEQLDQLVFLRKSLVELIKEINNLYSLQLFCYVVYLVFSFLVDNFIGYILITRLLKQDYSVVPGLYNNIVANVIASVDLAFLINGCNGVMEEV